MHTIDYRLPINRHINMAVQAVEFLLFFAETPAVSNPTPDVFFIVFFNFCHDVSG
jgi:hypothetical protein